MLLFQRSKYLSHSDRIKKELFIDAIIVICWRLLIWGIVFYMLYKTHLYVSKVLLCKQTGGQPTEILLSQKGQTKKEN